MENIIFGIVGVIGTIITIVGFIKRREKKPSWDIHNVLLIKSYKNKYSNLKISYKDNEVETLSVSNIVIWNAGSEPITKTDIETKNHLRIIPKGNVSILESNIIQEKNTSNCLGIDFNTGKNQIEIYFDYLNKGDGGVIQIFHTGTNNKDLDVVGDLVGAKIIQKNVLRKLSLKDYIQVGLVFALMNCTMFYLIYSIQIFLGMSRNILLDLLVSLGLILLLLYFFFGKSYRLNDFSKFFEE
jgi:hypothetical protein